MALLCSGILPHEISLLWYSASWYFSLHWYSSSWYFPALVFFLTRFPCYSGILPHDISVPWYFASWCRLPKSFCQTTPDQRICNCGEYTSGFSASFNIWLWSQNKGKVDADFQASREEQNWYSKLSVHNNPDSNFCVNFLIFLIQHGLSSLCLDHIINTSYKKT